MERITRSCTRDASMKVNSLLLAFLFLMAGGSTAQNMVGSLGGEVAVSHEGLATYAIPIEVVPGTKGMQPNLAVVYCSHGGSGLLGSCWTLAGLSSITRTPRDFYHDGDAGSVNFDGSDRYALDGARLVRLSTGAYASKGAVYGKDVEDFTRVTLHGTPDTQSQYFTAVMADGTVAEYGKDNQCHSKQLLDTMVLSWWVDRVTDPDGNYMTFQYHTYSGQTVPTVIYYTRNTAANLENYALVAFSYTDNPSPNKTWVGGKPMTATKLLSGITVQYNTTVVRQYAFEYTHDRSARLTAVVLKDGAGHELTRTAIGWGADGQTVSYQTVYGTQGNVIKTGNFTGDNLTDLLLYGYDPGTQTTSWTVWKGDGTGHFTPSSLSGAFGGGTDSYASLAVADYDGNGIDEIGYTQYDPDDDSVRYMAVSFPGTGHQTRTLASNDADAGGFLAGRFLGTGGLQVLRVGKAVGNTRTITCLENGATATVHKDARLAVTDVNGNGKSEIQAVGEHDVKAYEYDAQGGTFTQVIDHYMEYVSRRDFFGDLNGDGYTDYIYYSLDGYFLKMSKGNDYCPSDALPFNTEHLNDGKPRWPLLVGDLNGDGKDDIVQPIFDFDEQKLTLHTCLSRRYASTGWVYDTLQLYNPGVNHHYEIMYTFTELNGDGKNELFYSGSIFQDPVIVSLPEHRTHDLAATFTDGYGKTTALAYGYYATPDIGYLGVSGRRVHWPLARAVAEPDGIGGTALTVHTFGMAFNDSLCGVLGFHYHEAYRDGTNTQFLFQHDTGHHRIDLEQSLVYHEPKDPDELGGFVSDSSFWNPGRDRFYHRQTLNTLSVLELPYGRIVPYSSVSSDIDRLGNAVRTVSLHLGSDGRRDWDVARTRRVGAAFGDWLELDSTVYAYTTVVLPNGGQVKKPSSVKTWHRRQGCSQSPWQRMQYAYVSGRLSTATASDSDGMVSSTSYAYNACGMPVTETITPNGLDAATTVYGYDSKRRFVTSVTDPLGNTRTTNYNNMTGLPTSETDINGLTTSYQYDALGRAIRVTRPDGTAVNTSYAWNATAAFGDAVWYVRTTEDGRPETRTWFDVLGREVHSYVAGLGYDDVVYDSLGRVARTTSVPYASANELFVSKTWSETSHDIYGRVVAEKGPYSNLSYTYYDGRDPEVDCFVTVFDSIRNTRRTRTWDAAGRLVQAEDAGGTVAYAYGYTTRSGRTLDSTAVACGGATTVVFSDIRGNRVRIEDPDAGTVSSAYDALGRLTESTDANGVTTAHAYDLLGRVTRTVRSDGLSGDTVAYVYDSAPGKGKGRLHKVRHNGADETVYGYDNLGRLSEEESIDGAAHYVQGYSYDNAGRLLCLTYPDGFVLRHSYNSLGQLVSLTDGSNDSMVFSIDTRDLLGHPLKCRYGNGTGVQYTYNANGLLTGIRNGDVTDAANIHWLGHDVTYTIGGEYRRLSYTYDARGFVATRAEANASQSEAYAYDALDRLVSYSVNGVTAGSFTYDGKGNITANSRVGSYAYGDAGPHAVTAVTGGIACPVPNATCEVSYSLWNRPVSIAENGYRAAIDYGADGQRRHTRFLHNNLLQKTVTRVSGLHEVETTGSATRSLDYVFAEGRLVAVHVSKGSADSLYYVLTDHLGSWEMVLDEDKNVVQQTHFDPWGNRMSYTAWNTRQTQVAFPFSRGFTGHEHYDRFKIVNANARLYDPVIGRFFSPDPYVQMPDFTQNYNRYSYCLNNPVMYSDENGEWVHIAVGAVVGGLVNLGIKAYQGKIHSFMDGLAAFGIGAAAGALGAATGGAAFTALWGGAAGAGGFIAGAGGAMMGTAFSSPVENIGNAIYFNDPLMTPKEYLVGIGISGLVGGSINGGAALLHGRSFLTGSVASSKTFTVPTKPSFKIDTPESKLNTDGLLSPMESPQNSGSEIYYLENAKHTIKEVDGLRFTLRDPNFRNNLISASGIDPGSAAQAHHVFPLKYSSFFESAGINPNSYGAWWGEGHLQNAYRYNQAWRQFIRVYPNANQQDIYNFAIRLKLQFKY